MLAVFFVIFLALAFAAFVIEAVWRRSLVAGGLAFWVLVALINAFNAARAA